MANNGMSQGMKATMMWVIGVAIIAFILLIMTIIFGNLYGNTGFAQDSTTALNQTVLAVNETGSVFGNSTLSGASCTVNQVYNETGSQTLNSANYTVTDCTIYCNSCTMGSNNTLWRINSTTTHDSQGALDSQSIILNYTQSATNVSGQFPTVGTIIGIAILLLVLIALLVFAITKMMGVSNVAGGGSSGSSTNGFSGSSKEFG